MKRTVDGSTQHPERQNEVDRLLWWWCDRVFFVAIVVVLCAVFVELISNDSWYSIGGFAAAIGLFCLYGCVRPKVD